MAGSQSGSSQADSSQSEMSLGERIADLAFSWQTIHEFLSDSPQSVKEKYKARGFELYFYESFNGLPEPADDAAATFSFKAHYPGDENKATEVLTKSHEALRPHLEAASDACYAANDALKKLLRDISNRPEDRYNEVVGDVSTVLINVSKLHRHLAEVKEIMKRDGHERYLQEEE